MNIFSNKYRKGKKLEEKRKLTFPAIKRKVWCDMRTISFSSTDYTAENTILIYNSCYKSYRQCCFYKITLTPNWWIADKVVVESNKIIGIVRNTLNIQIIVNIHLEENVW